MSDISHIRTSIWPIFFFEIWWFFERSSDRQSLLWNYSQKKKWKKMIGESLSTSCHQKKIYNIFKSAISPSSRLQFGRICFWISVFFCNESRYIIFFVNFGPDVSNVILKLAAKKKFCKKMNKEKLFLLGPRKCSMEVPACAWSLLNIAAKNWNCHIH